MKKFNPYQNIKIDAVKAHHSILRKQKKDFSHSKNDDYNDDYNSRVFLVQNVKGDRIKVCYV